MTELKEDIFSRCSRNNSFQVHIRLYYGGSRIRINIEVPSTYALFLVAVCLRKPALGETSNDIQTMPTSPSHEPWLSNYNACKGLGHRRQRTSVDRADDRSCIWVCLTATHPATRI